MSRRDASAPRPPYPTGVCAARPTPGPAGTAALPEALAPRNMPRDTYTSAAPGKGALPGVYSHTPESALAWQISAS